MWTPPENITKEELIEKHGIFKTALLMAERLSTDELLDKFNELQYKSWGHGALMIYKYTDREEWDCMLRNESEGSRANLANVKLDCKAKTPKESLNLIYAWCVYRGHLKAEDIPKKQQIDARAFAKEYALWCISTGQKYINALSPNFTLDEEPMDIFERDYYGKGWMNNLVK